MGRTYLPPSCLLLSLLIYFVDIVFVYIVQNELVEALRADEIFSQQPNTSPGEARNIRANSCSKEVHIQMPHVPSLPLMITDGEDEASHDRHVQVLSMEHACHGKLHPHHLRRQRILAGQFSMESLLKTYPPIRQYNQVWGYCWVDVDPYFHDFTMTL